MSTTKIFIGGLPNDCTHADIETILKHYNYSDDVVRSFEINLVRDRTTDKFKGFAYVDVRSVERVEELLNLDGAEFANKRLRVDRATPKTNSNRGGRGEHHGNRPSRGGDNCRGGGSNDFGRGGGWHRGGSRDGQGGRGRDGRRNSERRGSCEEKHQDGHDSAPKPSGRPRLQLTPLTTDPAALEAKRQKEAEEEEARRAKLFQA